MQIKREIANERERERKREIDIEREKDMFKLTK